MVSSTQVISTILVAGAATWLWRSQQSNSVTKNAQGCGCNGNKRKQDDFESHTGKHGRYPQVFDPVFDYIPRYRYPPGTAWSNEYNPAQSYRPLDYQSVSFDAPTRAGGLA
tara:strand:- start:582 stop:914 length:333 start_codon:yes stop_codon:yes gene_type:complete